MVEGLYLITDGNRDGNLLRRVDAAVRGGASVVQYRDKENPSLETARRLAALCREAGVTFIVNDSPRLALESGADGVHLGQGDGELRDARTLLGPKRLIGVSTRTVEQARQAEEAGADYIGLGSIYPTATKGDALHVGLETLGRVRSAVRLPVVAIGGIDRDGAGAAIDAGADAVAVVSAVMGDPYPALAAREIALQFNRRAEPPAGRVLTVAGSDSGGGAGIQADLKTVTLLGGYGMSALTALTAQNTLGVHGVHPVPLDFIEAQIEAVLADIGADVIKTGMLHSPGVVRLVARLIGERSLPAVVDPVMVAKGGASLLQADAVEALRGELLPKTYLLTPNLPEAEALTGLPVRNEAEMRDAARALQEMGARNVLLKGGHLEGEALDLLLSGGEFFRLPAPRIPTANTHGTGCSYAAAIAALLARGEALPGAVARAKEFIGEAILNSRPLGGGHGPVNHWQGAKTVTGNS